MHQRNAEQVGQPDADITGVRIVTVHQVRHPRLPVQPRREVVHEAVEVVPQGLFRDVLVGAGGDADDARFVRQLLERLAVVAADHRIFDAAGDQVDLGDVVAAGEGMRQIDDILCLSTGVGVSAELEVMAPDQAMYADQYEVSAVVRLGHASPGFCCEAAPGRCRLGLRGERLLSAMCRRMQLVFMGGVREFGARCRLIRCGRPPPADVRLVRCSPRRSGPSCRA